MISWCCDLYNLNARMHFKKSMLTRNIYRKIMIFKLFFEHLSHVIQKKDIHVFFFNSYLNHCYYTQ